jgi:hypothetical protein
MGSRLLACLVVLSGCAKLVGIDDYKLHDAAEDGPPPEYFPPDARFGDTLTYIKASNAGAADQFGGAMAMSADGATLVVAAPFEDSNAIGVNMDQTNNVATDAGAVYVLTRSGTTWMQQAYLKPSNTGAQDHFGFAVAISGDGNTIVVGSPQEDGSNVGINPADNNNAGSAGAVYVFVNNGGTWIQQAYIKASNTDGNDEFGTSVALAADGNTLVVGAPNEDSTDTGINGNQGDGNAANGEVDYGAVYAFVRASGVWVQQAYIKASNSGANDNFGQAVALAADGDTLAVGAPAEDSVATGINGNQSDNSRGDSGAAYVFRRVSGIWAQQAYIKQSAVGTTGANDQFGSSIAISADGITLAVGAPGEDSNTIGINSTPTETAASSGAVFVYVQVAATWTTQAYLKPSNTGAQDLFGLSLALSADGAGLLVGAPAEDSGSDGLGGNQGDNAVIDAGAAYAFTHTSVWAQSYYVKATNSETTDRFGQTVAVSPGLLVVGAIQEDGATMGIGGDQASNTALNAGAIYVAQ